MRPGSFVDTSISVASMRPLLLANPAGNFTGWKYRQPKYPRAPITITTRIPSHLFAVMVRFLLRRQSSACSCLDPRSCSWRRRGLLHHQDRDGRITDDFLGLAPPQEPADPGPAVASD